MGILSIGSDFFGLDIGTTAIRVVQMRGGRNKVLVNYGSIEIDSKISRSDSNADQTAKIPPGVSVSRMFANPASE